MYYTAKRQRLVGQLLEKYDIGRIGAAAGFMLARERGATDTEGVRLSNNEIATYVEGLDERGIKRLAKFCKRVGEPEIMLKH